MLAFPAGMVFFLFFFTAGRNIWPDYTQTDRKTLGTQHQAGSACSVCFRVGQIKGTWWNRRIWKREGWVQEKAEREMQTEMGEWKSRDMKRGWGWKTEGSEWDESSIDSQVSERELTRGQKEGEWGGEKGTEEVNNRTSVRERENGEGQKYRQVKTAREEKFLRGAFGLKVKWWHIYLRIYKYIEKVLVNEAFWCWVQDKHLWTRRSFTII